MINTLVRPADVKDHQQLSNLIFFESRLHRHLDWRSPLEWLGAPFYWALEEDGQITAALACPTERDQIAWIRLFVYTGRWSAESAWNIIWSAARQEVAQAGGATVAAIAIQPWFQEVLAGSGFAIGRAEVTPGEAGAPALAGLRAGIEARVTAALPGAVQVEHQAGGAIEACRNVHLIGARQPADHQFARRISARQRRRRWIAVSDQRQHGGHHGRHSRECVESQHSRPRLLDPTAASMQFSIRSQHEQRMPDQAKQ